MPEFVLNNRANTFTGTVSDDQIYGLGGNDKLNGNRGDDLVDGGSGNDYIQGGFGIDDLYGGSGRDTFRFADLGTGYYETENDQIHDFARGDKINIEEVDVFAFDGYNNYDPEPGEWSIWYGAGKSFLIWDTFGDQHSVGVSGKTLLTSDVIW